ncbi:hypothetical protein [Streptomyces sp. BE133]|uniref:hypothetical protein n=1 Tax=Streptomyces sp. BE133 TaxID=3002523 RepID=UPI002E771DDB|nr:hypothetical protein [Streptomyces sp. BE133]MEE1812691.1 hypothetical protein [Streptomyces sp. BE133]
MTNSLPPSVDYTGAPLRIGQNVTFIEKRPGGAGEPRLYTGEIKLIGDEQLVVESGERFFIVEGRESNQPEQIMYTGVLALPTPNGG